MFLLSAQQTFQADRVQSLGFDVSTDNAHDDWGGHHQQLSDHPFVQSQRTGDRSNHRRLLFLSAHDSFEQSTALFHELFFFSAPEQIAQFVQDSVILLAHHIEYVASSLLRVRFFH